MPTFLPSGVRDQLQALQFGNQSQADIDGLGWEQQSLDDIARLTAPPSPMPSGLDVAPAHAAATPQATGVYEAPPPISLQMPRRPVDPNAGQIRTAWKADPTSPDIQSFGATSPVAAIPALPAAPSFPQAASGTPSAMPTAQRTLSNGDTVGDVSMSQGYGPPEGDGSGAIQGTSRPERIASALQYARAAEQRTGVPADVNLAFAVHESGLEDGYGPGYSYHGRHAVGDEPGTPINDWGYDAQGNRVDYPTKLKSYQDASGSFQDFADLIANSPRYQPALQRYQQSGDKAQLVRDIWAAGYGESKTGPDETVDILGNQVAPIASQRGAVAMPVRANIPASQANQRINPQATTSAYSGPYTQQALADAGDPDAWAKCGPVAAFQFAQKMGRAPTPAETEELARQVGWTGSKGMAGFQSEANLLAKMNIAARAESGVDWDKVITDVSRGNPVLLELPGHEGHYITAQNYDPKTGRIDFGSTVGDLAAAHHGTQFTPSELEGLGWGTPTHSFYVDNPATPAPSVVAGRSAPTAGAAPSAPAAPPSAPAAAAPAPPSAAGAPDPLRDQLGASSGGLNLRQPLGAANMGPDTTGDAPPASTYNDPTDAGTLSQPLPDQPPQPDYQYSQGDQQYPPSDYQPTPVRPAQSNLDISYAQDSGVNDYPSDQYQQVSTSGARPLASSYNDPTTYDQQPLPPQAVAQGPASQIMQQGMPEIPFKEGFTPILDAGHKVIAWIKDGAEAAKSGIQAAGEDIKSAAPGAASAAVQTATEAYNDPLWQTVPAPARAAYIVTQTAQAFGNSVGRDAAQALGIPDQEIVNILGHPVTSHDIAGFVGGAVFDPTTYVGGGHADPMVSVARGAAEDLAGPVLRGAARGIDAGIEAVRGPAARVAEGVSANAARVAEEAAPVAARVTSEAPQVAQPSFRDFSRTLETPANENNQLAILPTAPRPTNDQLIREEFGRPWQELPRSSATQEMTNEANGLIPRPQDRVNPADIENTLPTDSYTPNMSGRMNVSPGVSRSAGLIGDAANAIGGGVGGATIGAGLPADSDEERRQHALIGAGAGMLAGPAIGRLLPREGGALATFGASPNYRPPTAAQLKAAELQGARRGEMLNRPVTAPDSAVPRTVRAATAGTDDRAGMRWAENILSDAAGKPRMAENDPARPSTLSRINAGNTANERIATELEPAITDAGKAGLQHELPQYVEDMHQKDILDNAYTKGRQAVLDDRAQKIAAAQSRGANAAVIQRMQAKAATDAEAAGTAAMHTREGQSASMTYPQIEARLQTQEARLKASGQWDQLQTSAQAVWGAGHTTLQRLADSSNVDPAVAADLQQRFPHYVPTVPVSHLTEGGGGAGGAKTLVSRGTTPSINALEDVGTSGERLNPIVAARNQIVTAERQIQRNTIARAFAQMMDDATAVSPQTTATNPATHRTLLGGGVNISYMENGKPVTMSVPKPIADGIEAATNMGVDANGFSTVMKRLTRAVTSTLTAARASFIPVNTLRDLSDYATRTMVREGNNPAKLPAILGTWADEAGKAAMDIMAANATGRTAIGAATGFGAGALQGDDTTPLGTRLQHGAEGAAAGALLLGANKVQTTGKAAEFLARGGGEGAASSGLKAGQRWYRDVLRDGGAPIKSPQDALHALGDWAHDVMTLQGVKGVNERMETVSRTAAMRRAEAGGANAIESMIAGRDASVDFDRAGTVTRAWNGFIPFLNATVQGGAQFGRMFRGDPGLTKTQRAQHIATTTAAIGATLGPVMMATEYYNRSDPARAQAYDDVPQYVKDSGIVLMMPNAGSDNRGSKPNYLWLPTEALSPFVVGMRAAMQHADAVVSGVSPSAGRSDAAASVPGAPEGVKQGLGALNEALSVFYPVKGDSAMSIASTAVPPLFRQAIELGQNKDMFRGGTISSPSQDERASGLGHTVAGAANAAGRTLGNQTLQNITPSQVDYLTRQLPAYGDIITGASDMVKPSPYKQAEQGRIANEPFTGGLASRFVRDAGGANLERAQGQAMTQGVQEVLQDANMRPSDANLNVPSSYKNAPLTRDEQLRWQEAANNEMARVLPQARRDEKWRNPMTRDEAVKAAITAAHQAAADRVLRNLTDTVIQQRQRAEASRQRQAVGVR